MDSGNVTIERLFLLLNYSFPSIVFVCIGNAGLSDKVFGLASFVGRKCLPKLLRRTLERMFAHMAAAVGVFTAIWTLGACGVGPDFCYTTGLFESPPCVKAAVLSTVVVLFSLLCDRVVLKVVGIEETRMSRVADSIGVAVTWIALSEQDPVAALAIVVLSLRRLRFLQRTVGRWVVRAARLGLLSTCVLAMGGACPGVAPKNAAGGILLSFVL